MAFEAIPSPYNKVRGANYFPTYHTLNSAPPPAWHGVSGPDVAWFRYDNDDTPGGTAYEVHQQLLRLKQAGINTIRVWLPYEPTEVGFSSYSYVGDKVGFISKFAHFVNICTTVEIRMIPILFDSFTKSPSQAALTAILANYAASDAKQFVDDILGIVDINPDALFMLDLYNEPWIGGAPAAADMQAFLEHTSSQVKAWNANYTTLVGAAGWSTANEPVAIAQNANVDVLSIHPYSLSPYFTEALLQDTYDIAPKPVIATECGSPGWGFLYRDAIKHSATVEGVEPNGIGWCLYQAMVGWAHVDSLFPHIFISGMFHHDGQVRSAKDVLAIRQAALDDGIPSGDLYSEAEINALQISSGDPAYVPQVPVEHIYGGIDWAFNLWTLGGIRIESMNAAERDAIAESCYRVCMYDILAGSIAMNSRWRGWDNSNLLPLIDSYETNPAWGNMTEAEQRSLLVDWRRAIRPYFKHQAIDNPVYYY